MKNSNSSSSNTNNRFNPRHWSRAKQVGIGALGLVVLTAGWAAFRPEKLFVNERVNESFPAQTVGMSAPALVSSGTFTSEAHHTMGAAQIYQTGDSYTLRLSNFVTSNGPDVHVYLTKGQSTDNASIKNGQFLDLGVIKGNVGDQNYKLPAGFKTANYEGVSIWCKRFGVGFGGANFSADANGGANGDAMKPGIVQASMPVAAMDEHKMAPSPAAATPSVVTTGAFQKITHATKGTATITENEQGQRVLTLKGFETGKGPKLHLYLYKAEQVKSNDAAKKLVAAKKFIDLGVLKSTSGPQTYTVPADIDLWEFLNVGVWCDQFKVSFATAPLASPQ